MPPRLWRVGPENANDSFLARLMSRPPYRYVRPSDIHTVLPCDDISTNWAVTGGAKSEDSVNCFCGSHHDQASDISIKVTASAAGSQLRYDFGAGTPIDLTDGAGHANKVVVVRMYIWGTPAVPLSSDTTLKINIYDEGFANRDQVYLFRTDLMALTGADLAGWYEIAVPASCFTHAAGALDLAAVRYMDLLFITSPTTYINWTLDRVLVFTPPNATGLWALRIDSTYDPKNQYLAEYLNYKGVRASFGVQAGVIGQATYHTAASLRLLQQMGHEIVIYTVSAPVWRQKTLAQKITSIESTAAWMRENGIYPVGGSILLLSGLSGWLPSDERDLRGRYCLCHSGRNDYGDDRITTLWDVSRLDVAHFINGASYTVPGTVATQIAQAEDNRGVFILGSHNLYDAEREGVRDIVDALCASALKNVTLGEIYRGEI